MPSGDLLDLAQAAARAAQFDPTDTAVDLVRAKAAVNEAYLVVCHDGSAWDFLEREGQWTTAAGSDVYTYASIAAAMSITGATIREIVALTNDTDGTPPLPATTWRELESLAASTKDSAEADGAPTMWAKWGSRIRIYPRLDGVYTMGTFCRLTPNEMSADTDTPLIPLAYRHAVLVPYAAAILLEQEGGAEAGADYERRMARHREAHRAMRTALAGPKESTFSVVAPTAFRDLDDGSA